MDKLTIIGSGPSALKYERQSDEEGEVWVINRAFLLEQEPDRMFLFHPIEEVFPELRDRMLFEHSKPDVVTNQKGTYNSVEYPIDEVVKETGITYFTSTAAYCLAYAAMMGYKEVVLFGMDYMEGAERPEEKSCVEFWIGFLRGRGTEVRIHPDSTLCTGLFYGYENMAKFEDEDISLRRT